MKLPGGIRVRIALALTGIVAAALGAAYVIVVPSLENRLVKARLDQLQELAVPLAARLPTNRFLWPDAVDTFALATDARVVALDVLTRTPPALTVAADSQSGSSGDVAENPIALRALESGKVERGRVQVASADLGDVAVPLDWGAVLLFRASLDDSLATVSLVERRLLLATAFALALALALGLFAAGTLVNRVRRLETAAERIAGGDFAAPVIDRGDDEIGQLAHAFDRMRVQLAQLDSARKEFVANASHELRTPLFSLGGFLELLLDEDLDEETRREFLTTMQTQMERLTKLSADLLDLSRVDAGQLSVVHELVNLGDVAAALARELEHMAAASGHRLDTSVEDEVWCDADEERVHQIARALVVNALVHTPAGARVVIRARRRATRAELAVEDDGPGVPIGQHDAIFERFYRAEGRVASGSGLGLAIAKELARLMGGSVEVESKPGRTVFTLVLPCEAEPPSFSRENTRSMTH
ncbi:MAG: HAMP domain-containing histidine kinase [Actinobacteria bacterium]|nr:HAMP domain-containing histidine kinase [Actinomycetota bacterium]